jgi:hypothetical protein
VSLELVGHPLIDLSRQVRFHFIDFSLERRHLAIDRAIGPHQRLT